MLEILNIIQFTVPMYTALICGLLFLRMYNRNESPLGRSNIKWAILAYFISAFVWFSVALYVAMPKVYAILNPIILLSFIIIHILYYRFIFEITRVDSDEKFSILHYFIPALLFILITILSIFVPFNLRLHFIESHEAWIKDHEIYSIFFTSNPIFYFIFQIVYAIFGLRRTIIYRKIIINYSADEQRISLTWLYQLLFILLAAFPMLITILILPKALIISSGISIIVIIISMLTDIILAHNVLLENYVIIKPEQQTNSKNDTITKSTVQESVQKLETYMQQKKPYLNPRLKITDMTIDLHTNRTSLSALINKTYGVNFCRYINRFRLEELERIKSNSRYSNLDELDIIAKAGFSDYRGYKRVKQKEEEENRKNQDHIYDI